MAQEGETPGPPETSDRRASGRCFLWSQVLSLAWLQKQCEGICSPAWGPRAGAPGQSSHQALCISKGSGRLRKPS